MTQLFANDIAALPPGVKLTTLDNGLVIIVREDHSAPVVSAQAWAMAGSIHEGRWLGAGLSHVLEHMLFKGTTTRPGSRIDQEVQEAGGYMNAYTSFDRTVYHIDVPNTGARTAIDILCDIMQHASLPPDELAKEMDVIRREMDMNVDDPGRRASRRLFETAYTRSPYRLTVIGYPDIFNELKPEDIRGYYTEKYAPNNVFFVVAGDVKNDEVVAQIKTAYANSKVEGDAADGFARGTEADGGARNRGGSAHRTGACAFRVAHPGIAPSRRAGAGRAGRVARQRAQFAAVPASAREAGPGASRGRVDLQSRAIPACSASARLWTRTSSPPRATRFSPKSTKSNPCRFPPTR